MSGNPNIARFAKTHRAQFLIENLNLPNATGVENAVWEFFQIDHLNDDGIFRIEDKSRQIAWSWLIAAEATAEAILGAHDTIFVSINLEEAKEKIRYAKSVYENLEIGGLPKLITDNSLEIEFANGARVSSLPSKPPRGRARARVRLDEFAHVQHDRKIYTAALPIISKGGNLRIGSSPLGASGVFWEVFTESMKAYPGYTRKKTPWWEVEAFCRNVRDARRLAPEMDSATRVELFGNDRIKAIFANILLEDFQQEYEAAFVDETTAWISWAEIKAVQNEGLKFFEAKCRDSKISDALLTIETFAGAVQRGEIENVFAGGGDIGRTKNTTEFGLIGKSTAETMPLRLMISLDNCDFDSQEAVLNKMMNVLPITKFLLDKNGLGRQLAENAEKRFSSKVEGFDFTNASKELLATNTKMLFQQRKTMIPVDRDLAYQIHSIKKKVTAAKNNVFDTDRNEKHHADKFWMLALALQAANQPVFERRESANYEEETTYW